MAMRWTKSAPPRSILWLERIKEELKSDEEDSDSDSDAELWYRAKLLQRRLSLDSATSSTSKSPLPQPAAYAMRQEDDTPVPSSDSGAESATAEQQSQGERDSQQALSRKRRWQVQREERRAKLRISIDDDDEEPSTTAWNASRDWEVPTIEEPSSPPDSDSEVIPPRYGYHMPSRRTEPVIADHQEVHENVGLASRMAMMEQRVPALEAETAALRLQIQQQQEEGSIGADVDDSSNARMVLLLQEQVQRLQQREQELMRALVRAGSSEPAVSLTIPPNPWLALHHAVTMQMQSRTHGTQSG
ncbi:hypothetical protein BBJ28_00012003 [Nothophytophthora sp. Chile5]|nr:hypothetical protein BBJ28_00012003 [Nothophytophthora sp. Chile5]